MYELNQTFSTPELPREKLAHKGVELLNTAELLAIILNTGTKKESVSDMASRVVREYGTSALAPARDFRKLRDHLQIGEVKSMQLIAVMELGRRIFMESDGKRPVLNTPDKVWKRFRFLATKNREELHGLYINSRQRLVASEFLSIGSIGNIYISKRDIFAPALEFNAQGIIIVHNHPSGNAEPSTDDRELTEELMYASKLMGITFLDHVIVGSEAYFSFREEGLLEDLYT